ncbi:hypothetical protein C8J56DRAFT_949140, partial [Mycena floridula]
MMRFRIIHISSIAQSLNLFRTLPSVLLSILVPSLDGAWTSRCSLKLSLFSLVVEMEKWKHRFGDEDAPKAPKNKERSSALLTCCGNENELQSMQLARPDRLLEMTADYAETRTQSWALSIMRFSPWLF